jgi:hypothetical protein
MNSEFFRNSAVLIGKSAVFLIWIPIAYFSFDLFYGAFIFRPQDIGRVRAGMVAEDVERILGRPSVVHKSSDGTTTAVFSHRWRWDYATVVYQADGHVVRTVYDD